MRGTVAKKLKAMAVEIVYAKTNGKPSKNKTIQGSDGANYYPNSSTHGLYRSLKKRYRELGYAAFTRTLQQSQSK